MIKDFKYCEQDKKIFKQYIEKFIPKKVIDFHIHIWQKELVSKDIDSSKELSDPFFSFNVINEFTFNDFQNISKILFPGIEYEGLFFGAPFKEIDIEGNNQIIIGEARRNNIKGLLVTSTDFKPLYIEDKIHSGSLYGFKPYPELVVGKSYSRSEDNVCIMDIITDEQLSIANKYNLIIMLHIPKSKRLRDKKNIEEIVNISKSYPNLKLVLAHAGRSYCLYDIIDCINIIKKLKNVYVDTSFINNWEVIEILLKNVGSEKILYGSDFPLAAIKGKNICVNDKHYFFTSRPFPWSISNPNIDDRYVTFFIYEEIREILKAVFRNKFDRKVIDNIFYNNARNLTENIKKKKIK